MTPEYIIGTILLGGISAVFALYQRGTSNTLAAKDQTIAAQAEQIAWLRSQIEPLLKATQTAVLSAEQILKGKT